MPRKSRYDDLVREATTKQTLSREQQMIEKEITASTPQGPKIDPATPQQSSQPQELSEAEAKQKRLSDILERIDTSMESNKPLSGSEREDLKSELRSVFADVRFRGFTSTRMDIALPPEVYGEWVPLDQNEIDRKKLLGFKIDDTYAARASIGSDGTKKPIVGDCVFMTCPRIVKEVQDQLLNEEKTRVHGTRAQQAALRAEEQKFRDRVNKKIVNTGTEMPVVTEGRTEVVGAAELAAARQAAHRMDQPAGPTQDL